MNEFEFWIKHPINESLSIGDTVWYTTVWYNEIGGFELNDPSSQIVELGEVKSIEPLDLYGDGSVDYYKITCNLASVNNVPGDNDYVFFSKAKEVEEAGTLGYYAEITFKNNSKQPAELFMTGVEVTQSS